MRAKRKPSTRSDVLIAVEVNVDEDGNVVSPPNVETMYSNCL